MNHSAELKPRIPTPWQRSKPSCRDRTFFAGCHLRRTTTAVPGIRLFKCAAQISVPSGSSWRRCGRSDSTLCSSASFAAPHLSSSGLYSLQIAPQPRWAPGGWSQVARRTGQNPPSSVSPPLLPEWSRVPARLLPTQAASLGVELSLQEMKF